MFKGIFIVFYCIFFYWRRICSQTILMVSNFWSSVKTYNTKKPRNLLIWLNVKLCGPSDGIICHLACWPSCQTRLIEHKVMKQNWRGIDPQIWGRDQSFSHPAAEVVTPAATWRRSVLFLKLEPLNSAACEVASVILFEQGSSPDMNTFLRFHWPLTWFG